ncbi:protease inhibitor I42 family protein [Chloroflexota bacterium]
MKIKPILALITLTISMFLAGCTAPTQKAWVEVSCDEFNDNQHIETTLEVHAGETFEVKLCSNPTTGLEWWEEAQISVPSVLKQQNHEFRGQESEPPPPPGTPGQEIWTFKALQQGSSEIYLEYGRPWEGGEKREWTCTINVVVKESSSSAPVKGGDENQEKLISGESAWVLESYGQRDNLNTVLDGTKITAAFDKAEGRVHESAGCNTYSGDYQISDSTLSISWIASTEMACLEPEGSMDQEQQYLTILQAAESYKVQDGKLQINSGQQILTFTTD